MTSITIPASVTSIGESSFQDCKSLTSVNIPASVTSIGNDAFRNCTTLASVTIWAPSLTTYGSYAFYNNASGRKIYVLADCENTYKTGWESFSSDITAITGTPNAPTATSATLNAETAYWCTYYNGSANVVADASTTVYTVSLSSTAALLKEVSDKIIKAGQGVVLKSTNDSPTLTYASTIPTGDFTSNVLKGVDIATTCTAGDNYVLANGINGLGFYIYSGTSLGANKAYLPKSSVNAGARGIILFAEDETTSVDEDVRIEKGKTTGAMWYTIDGRKLQERPTQKGLYIHEGQKVIIK
ncbi:MAG: leucine-rich repeat domain-containing protein [Prevotella sp.]|nr:leucine-rich repeat domain-containing protein [Prevotella sp.]